MLHVPYPMFTLPHQDFHSLSVVKVGYRADLDDLLAAPPGGIVRVRMPDVPNWQASLEVSVGKFRIRYGTTPSEAIAALFESPAALSNPPY